MSTRKLIVGLTLLICWGSVAFSQERTDSVVSLWIEHATSSADGSAAWTFDRTVYQQDTRNLPIGVFDSGIGGLTVLEAILSLDAFDNETLAPGADGRPDFENEKFIYLGDQANMPYGNYPSVGKEDYLRELILKDVIFLLGKRYWPNTDAQIPMMTKQPVKAIAIGCNTATAYGSEEIQSALNAWDIPVPLVGVVDAGARGVLELHQSGVLNVNSLAVLATVGTCSSGAYPKAISIALGRAGRRVPTIVQQGFVDLAAAIEGDPAITSRATVAEIIRNDLRQLLEDYCDSGNDRPIGAIVLGCTHFPLVQSEIIDALAELKKTADVDGHRPFDDLVAEQIEVINPAEMIAKELFRTLARSRLRATSPADENVQPLQNQFYLSVANPRCNTVVLGDDGGLHPDYKYSRHTCQLEIEDTLVVPMRVDQLPPSSLNLIQTSLPNVWESLRGTARSKR